MTTIRDELRESPDRERVADPYVRKCSEVLGTDIVPGSWTPEEEAKASGLDKLFGSAEWLEQKGSLRR